MAVPTRIRFVAIAPQPRSPQRVKILQGLSLREIGSYGGAMASIRLAILNDYEIVVLGLGALFADRDDFDIVQLAVDASVDRDVDLVLYDTFGAVDPDLEKVQAIVADAHVDKVVVFTWGFADEAVQRALDVGVAGYLSKALVADELADALRRIHAGERVVSDGSERAPAGTDREWPGKGIDLTEKEADVLALITRGFDNRSIAEMLYISPNTLKTRVRKLYRKLGVENRVQAALWGVKHGFEPDNDIRWTDIRWTD